MRPLNISGSQAKDYYYGKDAFFGSYENSKWHGKLADDFKLSGQCKEHDFLNIIAGNDLKANQIIRDGVNCEHRAAIDIPFAAPKSVSVMALHAGDKDLIGAHEKAVADTIKYIEEKYLYARRTIDHETMAFQTQNGLFATFTHSTSRANDPHLHTHTLTMNMTDTERGYRALFNDPIFQDQTLLNFVYQSYLAKNVRDLGYGIDNGAGGKWEVAGFKKEWVDIFSTRTREVEKKQEQLKADPNNSNKPDGKLHDQAQKSSRNKKDLTLTIDDLLDLWQEKMDRLQLQKSVSRSNDRSIEMEASEQKLSKRDYVRLACKAIHENESTFSRQQVITLSLELSRGEYTVDEIEKAFLRENQDRNIQHLKTYYNKKGVQTRVFTTSKMLFTEQSIVRSFNRHKNDITPFFRNDQCRLFIDAKYDFLTEGQKQMVEHMLTSQSRFNIVQGDAGTGKTTALKAVKELIDKRNIRGVEIRGLGYTGIAAREIEKSTGIKSQTLHSFLGAESGPANGRHKIWVVDESSMVGSFQMNDLVKRAVTEDAIVHFVGDGKQLPAIPAGRMFKDLQKYGYVKPIKMEKVVRQESQYMIDAVSHVKKFMDAKDTNGVDKAFGVLSDRDRIVKIADDDQRINAVAEAFVNHDDRDNCLILTPTNKVRVEINEMLHNELRGKDEPQLEVDIKTPVSMRGVERYLAKSYEPGQKAFIEKSWIKGLKAGQHVTITEVDSKNNQLVLGRGKDRFTVDPKNTDVTFSVYNQDRRSFFKGEKIVFLKNDKKLDIANGQTAVIEKMGPKNIITAKIGDSDRKVRVNLDYYPFVDRGYAVTVNKSQGQTAGHVMYVADSKMPVNKSELLYVGITRAKHNFTLYADKPDEVRDQFKRSQVKTSVIEYCRNEYRKILERSQSQGKELA